MRGGRQGVSPLGNGMGGKAAMRAQAVIHDNGPGGGQIEGKGGGNAYEMLAARGKLRAQSPSFRAKHIGCPQGVGEARLLDLGHHGGAAALRPS